MNPNAALKQIQKLAKMILENQPDIDIDKIITRLWVYTCIEQIALITGKLQPDMLYIKTKLPTPFPVRKPAQLLTLKFETQTGFGFEYAKKNFGRTPDKIVDTTETLDQCPGGL